MRLLLALLLLVGGCAADTTQRAQKALHQVGHGLPTVECESVQKGNVTRTRCN